MDDSHLKNGAGAELFPERLLASLTAERLLAVFTVTDPDDAPPLARALVRGGIRVMELAWRTDATLEALRAIRSEVPEMLAGIGTLLTVDQMEAVQAAGAAFGVSPGLSTKLLRAARDLGFPYAPGVMTPSELQVALEYGCRTLKFFPAESGGGLKQLRAMNAPFAHLRPRYIVLGGLTEDNAAAYLDEPSVAALGGSWITGGGLIAARDWDGIERRARAARKAVERSAYAESHSVAASK